MKITGIAPDLGQIGQTATHTAVTRLEKWAKAQGYQTLVAYKNGQTAINIVPPQGDEYIQTIFCSNKGGTLESAWSSILEKAGQIRNKINDMTALSN